MKTMLKFNLFIGQSLGYFYGKQTNAQINSIHNLLLPAVYNDEGSPFKK